MSGDVSFDPRSGAAAASVAHTSADELKELVARAVAVAGDLRENRLADREAQLARGRCRRFGRKGRGAGPDRRLGDRAWIPHDSAARSLVRRVR